jgi:hypothetical protein
MRLDVVDRHGAGLAANIYDEVFNARHPDPIGAAECGSQARQHRRRADVDESGRLQ